MRVVPLSPKFFPRFSTLAALALLFSAVLLKLYLSHFEQPVNVGSVDRLLIGAAFLILTAAIGWIISQSRRAFSFVGTVSVSGNSLVLSEKVEYETGRLLIEGRSYYLGKGRHYQIERRFVKSSSGKGSEIVPIWDEFFVEINGDGIGYFNAPAVLIKTGKYSGLALIFLTSRSETRFRDTMHLEINGEEATVEYHFDGGVLRGVVHSWLSKARGIRLYISGGGGEVKKKLGGGREFEFSYRLLPEEDTVLVAPFRFITPMMILGNLGGFLPSPREGLLFGHGTYELKAVLNVPFGRDVVEKVTFRIEAGKN
ncbi:hypothetical protein [Thermococcus gammatolerans]|uniref:Uncharacterized protein n=1 Tax=Thermococcus gammatolerans (strain DSM 15229 / JCM 11827 / EJ3) TaxID=593117 RepID=C5A3A1_THEGJ|nr:hypothetical protein [Thermococcus gammatolerans]ACS32713.1 Hypothetical protein TGAM_0211 [Thermococcus gammatolerans EJ3]